MVILSIILVLVVSLAFTIPAVQTGVARWGTSKASEWLGAKVSLSKLDITFPLTVSIDDFYVEDYQRDTMIYVRHIEAPIKMVVPRPLNLHFGEVKLYDVSDRDAAMIMAIVADKLGKPLNELRFKSIKEVK